MDFGLSRITRLLRGKYPVLPWKAIHIAGTNGKGSTSAFLSGLLHQSGVNVGRFNSPHLIERHDCITINERPIKKDLFLKIEDEVQQRNEKAGIDATSFELLTATAFEAFARSEVDIGVVECGLGGTRDATNVLNADEVICSVITNIALDHADILGDTIEAIAREKAGIMKKDVAVVFHTNKAVGHVFRTVARQVGSKLPLRKSYSRTFGKQFKTIFGEILPPYQQTNLTLAYEAYMTARDQNPELIKLVNRNQIWNAVFEVKKNWRGRMERISLEAFAGRKKKILVDGAHNSQAAMLLRHHVDIMIRDEDRKLTPITWVIAMSGSKDSRAVLSKLINKDDRVVLTEFGPVDGMPWVTPASSSSLENVVKRFVSGEIRTASTPGDALKLAVSMTREDELIVVAGSLYLIGDILRIPAIGGRDDAETD